MLVPSLERIRRTIATETAYTLSRMRVLEAIPGNPVGIAHRRFDDDLVAMRASHLPPFNRVVGLGSGHEHHIEPIIQWYREEAGVRAQIEIAPGNHDAALGRERTRCGYYQAGFHTSLICEPRAESAASSVRIIQVTTPALLEDFLDTYAVGRQIPEVEGFKNNVRPWLGLEGWRLYLAYDHAQPAAVAILYLRDKVGYCADATTRPEFRGHGLQTALLQRRIAQANAAGVDFVCSGADFLSTSHRNMERAGMRVQFVRAVWRELELD